MKNALTTTQQQEQQEQVRDFSDAFASALVQPHDQAYSNRTVALLDDAGMGDHNVYVHWFRLDYGVWMDAEEVVNSGGLVAYLEGKGMGRADLRELLSQGWEIQAADGLAARCLRDRGDFDWEMLGELLDVLNRYRMAA